MDKIRHFYGQNCKKIHEIKIFTTIFNGFLETFCIKMIQFHIIFQKVTIHINSRKTIPYICK